VKFIRAVLLVALVAVAGHAQLSDNQKTVGSINGRGWVDIPSAAKVYFIAGYCEASNWAAIDTGPITAKCPAQVTYGEMVDGIDMFYRQHPEFMRLPVGMAMIFFRRKAEGVDPAEIEKAAAKAMAIWDAPAPTPGVK
jgi:hypothetical protein